MSDIDLVQVDNWCEEILRLTQPDPALVDRMLATAQPRIGRALRAVRRERAAAGVIASPLGDLIVVVSARGLAMLKYAASRDAASIEALVARAREVFDLAVDSAAIEPVRTELQRFFAGDPASLSYPVDFSLVGGGFQREVLERLRKVTPGATISYQALGAWAGVPNGARAVGNAMHTNPVAIYAPCHRVIESGGGLGGYAGGLPIKRKLLSLEGFRLGPGDRAMGAVLGHRATKVFCRPGCRAAARADRAQQLTFCDDSHAQRAGMRACKLCHPGEAAGG